MDTGHIEAACSYCGLPVITNASRHERPQAKLYCCLGCRIADGIVSQTDEGADARMLTRLGIAIFFSMNVMVFTLVLWSWDVHRMPEQASVDAFREVLRYACFLFSTPVLILLGEPLIRTCIDSLRAKRFTIDVLLAIGVVAAFGYSVVSLLTKSQNVYFEVACMILVAITLGKWLEATAKRKANNVLRSLQRLLPDEVTLIKAHKERTIPLEDVQVGDLVRVHPGERIPIDGTIEAGFASVDQQVITGESHPVIRRVGETVVGGSLNLDGVLTIRANQSAATGTVARLTQAIEQAAATRCAAIRRADRLAAWFVPLIVGAAAIAFYFHFSEGIQSSLMTSLSVILIACPCALGIATPLALWVAINAGSKKGILFRDGDAILRLATIRSLAFDKTGTLTDGRLKLLDMAWDASEVPRQREIVRLLAKSSRHALAKAIADALHDPEETDIHLTRLCLSEVQEHPGEGVVATVNYVTPTGRIQRTCQAAMGSAAFLRSQGFSISLPLAIVLDHHRDKATVCVGWNGKAKCVCLLEEHLRPELDGVVSRLRHQNLELRILSGDSNDRTRAVGSRTGIDAAGSLMPEQKLEELRLLPRPVAMVGDGINDSLALAACDIGISLDSGTDVARDAADICLLGNTLRNLPDAIELARLTQRAITQNLIWAVGYNVIGIGIAITGHLNPIVAAVAMVGSSFFVLTNSIRFALRLSKDAVDRTDSYLSSSANSPSDSRSESSSRSPSATSFGDATVSTQVENDAVERVGVVSN